MLTRSKKEAARPATRGPKLKIFKFKRRREYRRRRGYRDELTRIRVSAISAQ